jgi:cyanophycinase-like exopeptidase
VWLWKNAPVREAVQSVIDRGAPVGGASAGLAVLGEYVFTAEMDTVTSVRALANPFDERVTVGTDFLRVALLANTITDTHFARRDRMGRTLVFLARILAAGKTCEVRAIAADERTVALVEASGAISIVGRGAVYFLRASRPATVCRPGIPFTVGEIAAYRLRAGGAFDLKAWSGAGGEPYTLTVDNGVVRSSQSGCASRKPRMRQNLRRRRRVAARGHAASRL